MRLTRTIPGIGGLPQLRVYSCRECGVSLTEAEPPGGAALPRQRAAVGGAQPPPPNPQ